MTYFRSSIRFELQKNKNSKAPQPIRCWVSYNRGKFPIPTGIRCEQRHWNFPSNKKGDKDHHQDIERLVKQGSVSGRAHGEITPQLKDVKNKVSKLFEQECARLGQFPDHKEFKIKCENMIQKNGDELKEEVPGTLRQYLLKMIDDTKNGRRLKKNGEKYSGRSHTGLAYCATILKEFAEYARVPDFTFAQITLEFYYNLRDYIYGVKNKTDNTFGNIIQCIKAAMGEAKDDGLHQNMAYKGSRFIRPSVDVDNVALTEEQIQIISDKNFDHNETLSNVRDLFVIACWIGLRYGDLVRLDKKNIVNGFLEIKTSKTKSNLVIPIHKNIKDILKKYENTDKILPTTYCIPHFEENIKKVCEQAKLEDQVSLVKHRGGKELIVNIPLYKAVTAHTARRSFATNMFRMGVPTLVIMGITGHKTETSFLKYIKVGAKEKAEMMLEIWNRKQMKAVNE